MTRRQTCVAIAVVAAIAVGLLVLVGILVVNQPHGPLRKDKSVTVVIEKQPDELSTGRPSVGVGIGGRLGLIGHRCVGFVGDQDVVLVWPYGTTVVGSGKKIRITSEGKTVRLGQEIEAGSELGRDFSEVEKNLPAECRGHGLLQIGLNS